MPNPVEQQQIVQDPNPFEILANDEDSENEDDETQQVPPDKIKNQGAEEAINAKQNYFETNPEYQGSLKQVHGARRDHGN